MSLSMENECPDSVALMVSWTQPDPTASWMARAISCDADVGVDAEAVPHDVKPTTSAQAASDHSQRLFTSSPIWILAGCGNTPTSPALIRGIYRGSGKLV